MIMDGYAMRSHIYTAIHGEMVENGVPSPVLFVLPDIVMPVTDTEQLPLILWVWFMSADGGPVVVFGGPHGGP